MNVPSFEFFGFAAFVTIVINISRRAAWRSSIFAIANLAFVAAFTHDPKQLAPFGGLLLLGYVALKMAEAQKGRSTILLSIVALVAAFCWLKRYTFLPSEAFLPYAYFTVGMSYVFFRVLHLVIDANSGMLPERVGPIAYLSYTLNFTCLVSGPIQLYQDYRRTATESPAPLTAAALGRAMERIIEGSFKLTVLSPMLHAAFERSYGFLVPGLDQRHKILYGALTLMWFPIYLYVNFSGYTDLVIGVARFMRLELPENFNQPFRAVSFLDFWSRWHMTLSGWLKRYVYTSLAMSLIRRFPQPKFEPYIGVAAYFVTFFLIGLWHGQTSMFLVYGLLQGTGVSVNKLFSIAMVRSLGRKRYRSVCGNTLYAALSRGLTFSYFAATLLWFWASDVKLAELARTVGVFAAVGSASVLVLVASIGLAALYALEDRIVVWFDAGKLSLDPIYARTAWTTALLVITVSFSLVLNAPAPHVVYRGF